MSDSAIGKVSVEVEGNTLKFNKALKDAEKSVKSFGEIARETIIMNIVEKGFNAVVGAIGKTMAKMDDFAATTVEIGKTFDSSMSNVAAISGAAGDDLLALRDKAKEMGAATKYTATEAADAMSYMAMAGWKTEDMLNGVAGIMNLAAASGSDLAATSDIVTDALTAFGLVAGDSGRFADVLAAASSNANTNVMMMGETFKYAAPIAGAMGYSIEDTAVAIGLMANAGIKASQAGTSLRSIFTRLAAPTDKMVELMNEMGISVVNADGTMKPLSKVMGDLRGAFAKLTPEQQAQYAQTIAGQEAMSGLLAIVNASPADFEKLTNAVNGSTGAAERMAFTMINNLAGAQALANSQAEAFKLTLYEGVEPALTAVTKASGAMYGALMGAGDWMGILELASDELVNKIVEVSNTIPSLIQGIAYRIPQIIETLMPAILGSITTLIPALMSAFQSLAGALPSIIGALGEIIAATLSSLLTPANIQMLLDAFLNICVAIVDSITQNLPTILQGITNVIIGIVSFLTNPTNVAMIIQAAVSLLMALVNAIPQIIPPLIAALPTIIQNIITVFQQNLPVILNGAVQMFMALINCLPQIIEALGMALPTVINAITTFLSNPETITLLLNAAITMFYALIDALPTIMTALGNALPGVIASIIMFLTNPNTIMMLLNAAIQLFYALVSAVPQILGALLGAFRTLGLTLWENIKKIFGEFAANFGNFIGNMFKGAVNGVLTFIENMINGPIDIINGFINGINNAFGFIGVHLDVIGRVSLPRMEYGGIVPGDSYTGDHNLIRANSGEMVITRSQQAALWDMIERGNYDGVENGGDSIDNSQISISNNYQINSALDAEAMGDIILASIRKAVA